MNYRIHYLMDQTGNYAEDSMNVKSGIFSAEKVAEIAAKADYFDIESFGFQRLVIFDEKLLFMAEDVKISKIIKDAINKRR